MLKLAGNVKENTMFFAKGVIYSGLIKTYFHFKIRPIILRIKKMEVS